MDFGRACAYVWQSIMRHVQCLVVVWSLTWNRPTAKYPSSSRNASTFCTTARLTRRSDIFISTTGSKSVLSFIDPCNVDPPGQCGARGRCRISPPRFLAECRKRRLNQGSFVSAVCLVVCFLCTPQWHLYVGFHSTGCSWQPYLTLVLHIIIISSGFATAPPPHP